MPQMNDYRITIEEVTVHHADARADTPREAFEDVRRRYEAGEFDVPGECQEARVAVRTQEGETLVDFEPL